MSDQPRILAVFGTRPEAIKMAPLIKKLQACPELTCRVAVTAQHREMLDQVLGLFVLKPQYDLNLMQAGQSLTDITYRVLQGLEGVLRQDKPDLVLVHGDTTTTFAASLAAFYQQIPVGHVEAGLRTGNPYSPFPEEMNRHLTGVLAHYHFAPTARARANLLQEGVAPENIFVTGNTVIDALLEIAARPAHFSHLPRLRGGQVLLVTTHRRENLGGPLRQVYLALRDLVAAFPGVEVVFPVHLNPLVRQPVQEILGGLDRVYLLEPQEYAPFVHLLKNSYLVLTDSGGLQEEAPSLGKPVLVLREATERPEAIQAGTVRLVGTEREHIVAEVSRLLTDPVHYGAMAAAVNPYGDGQAAERTRDALNYVLGRTNRRPQDFSPD